jgi:aspartate dehydrogenase
VAGGILKIGLAGLGAVGLEVARRIEAGIPGLALAAVSARDPDKARRNLPDAGARIPILAPEALAQSCDVVVECLPPKMFRGLAISAIERGRIFMPLSVGQLLDNWDLVDLAKVKGARILVPTGALLGLDAVRAAAEGPVESITLETRKPPAGLRGAPYLEQNGIDIDEITAPCRVFEGTAFDAARGFPANVNVAAALALAGIGPVRTRVEIWADPTITRNTHTIHVEAEAARFTMTMEGVPSPENPRTGKLTALSVLACLRGLVSTLKVGS